MTTATTANFNPWTGTRYAQAQQRQRAADAAVCRETVEAGREALAETAGETQEAVS